MTVADMPHRVAAIVADALNVPVERVTPSASLIDDLGAESIDFLDILFRVETAFGIKIRESELWSGTIDRSSQQTIDASIERLKARQPDDRSPSAGTWRRAGLTLIGRGPIARGSRGHGGPHSRPQCDTPRGQPPPFGVPVLDRRREFGRHRPANVPGRLPKVA
jgi:acyl carrier protein